MQDELSAFADLERPDVDEWLYDLALGEGHPMEAGAQAGAIEALGRRDPARAFDSALRMMVMGAANREQAPRMLLDLDADRALPLLRKRLEEENEILLIMAIGENLYSTGHRQELLRWLENPLPRVREGVCIAAEVVPWSDELPRALHSLLYDADWDVRNAANQALDRLWHAREAGRVIDALLLESDASRRWRLLDLALELGAIPVCGNLNPG